MEEYYSLNSYLSWAQFTYKSLPTFSQVAKQVACAHGSSKGRPDFYSEVFPLFSQMPKIFPKTIFYLI